MDIIKEKKFKLDQSIEHLNNELKQIRTGRANPALVENLKIECYGSTSPLQQLASISIPDSRSILIQPWDKNITKDIEKSINSSSLGLNPINEGNSIRLPIPPLTEERRQELSKIVHEKEEAARISIRNIREEIWRTIKEKENNGQISEDDMFKQQKELQKIIDGYNQQIKSFTDEKDKEIMTI